MIEIEMRDGHLDGIGRDLMISAIEATESAEEAVRALLLAASDILRPGSESPAPPRVLHLVGGLTAPALANLGARR